VDIKIIEGTFTEVPNAAVTGTDRRASGEFVGPRGELASYAFGWDTGSDPRAGTLTIGIGAGNPGGGTFHAAVFEHEGGYAFALIDEPFEHVAQGGPDLTAEQARAHEDLPFVFWVGDQVMDRDRRARWMLHWLLGTTSIRTPQVWECREPVLLVGHDADDGIWQLIGTTGGGTEGKVGHLHHAIDEDPTLIDVLDLAPGHSASRTGVGGPWERRPGYPR
jgi:hypothetical protein